VTTKKPPWLPVYFREGAKERKYLSLKLLVDEVGFTQGNKKIKKRGEASFSSERKAAGSWRI